MQDRGEPVQNYEESHLQHAGDMLLYELYRGVAKNRVLEN
jgi:hypothetical protein